MLSVCSNKMNLNIIFLEHIGIAYQDHNNQYYFLLMTTNHPWPAPTRCRDIFPRPAVIARAICYLSPQPRPIYFAESFPDFPGARPRWVQRPPHTVTKLALRSPPPSSRKPPAEASVRTSWSAIASDFGAAAMDSPRAGCPAWTAWNTPALTRLVPNYFMQVDDRA